MPLSLYKFQRDPIDVINDPTIRSICCMSSAQLLKTTCLLGASQYLLANRPAHLMFATTTLEQLRTFRADKWDNGINFSPVLSDLVSAKSDKKSSNNQALQKLKDGTSIYFSNMNAPNTLRSKTVKYIMVDEVAAAKVDDKEGSPVALIQQRSKTHSDSLFMVASTPLHNGDLICTEWEQSDQRKFHVPCPHCNEFFEMTWDCVKFEFKPFGKRGRAKVDPETAKLHCPTCDGTISEVQRINSIEKGHWVITRPDVKGYAGFHISELYHPMTTIKKIAAAYSEAHYNFDLKSFYNLRLGLPYDDPMSQQVDNTLLENLRDFDVSLQSIPDDVLYCVSATDQQNNRLETTILGITDDERKIYVLDHRTFMATIDTCKVEDYAYKQLQVHLLQPLKTVSGREVELLGNFIDSGNGPATNTIHAICSRMKNKAGKRLLTAIKGTGNVDAPLHKESTSRGLTTMILNVNAAKDHVHRLIQQSTSEDPESYKNLIVTSGTLPEDWELQITSETKVFKNGAYRWEHTNKTERNEALDTLGYGLACARWVQSELAKKGRNPFHELRRNADIKRQMKANEINSTPTVKKTVKTQNFLRK